MKEKPKLCVATIDPSQVGGVTTMKEYFCKMAASRNYDPFIVFFPLNPEFSVRFKNLFSLNKVKMFLEGEYLGFKSYSIGTYFPEFEFMHYLSSFKYWKKVIEGSDLHFAVSGTNQSCLPYVMAGKKFICWVATTYLEDRKQNVISFSFVQKLLNFFSLPMVLLFERIIYKKAYKILVLSQYTKDMIIKKYQIQDSKIIVAPSPIDVDKFSPPISNHEGCRILFVGRVNDPRKNVIMLLKAFAKVVTEKKDVELWLVGENMSEKIQSMALELGVLNKIKCFANISHEDIDGFYKNCDIFVLPSFQEGLGIVVLEAMSCGLPAVLTRCGGPEWLIRDGINGLVVRNNDADGFAISLLKLVNDRELRLEIGNEARKTIIEKCSVEAVENIFSQALIDLEENGRR